MVKRGAMSTPARPAKNDDSAQAAADTRSAVMPLSSVIRGLSTTARMRRPIRVNLKTLASTITSSGISLLTGPEQTSQSWWAARVAAMCRRWRDSIASG